MSIDTNYRPWFVDLFLILCFCIAAWGFFIVLDSLRLTDTMRNFPYSIRTNGAP